MSCAIFTVIVYTMSAQPMSIVRFLMFFAISFYTVLVAQSFGLMIGAAFNVVVSTLNYLIYNHIKCMGSIHNVEHPMMVLLCDTFESKHRGSN